MIRHLIVFLTVGLLLSALSVSTVLVLAQIENLPYGVERIRADLVWDTDMWPQDFTVDPDGNTGQGAGRADIDVDKIVWARDLGIISVHFGEIDP